MQIVQRLHAWLRAGVVVAAVSSCMLTLGASAAPAAASHLNAQRAAFRAAWNAAQAGRDWRPLARGLEDYPLYPYLESVALRHAIAQASTADIDAYLARYPGMIPAEELRRAALLQAAQVKDWQRFTHFYRPGLGTALECDDLQARLAAGARLDFDTDLAALWQQTSLPAACGPVLNAAFSAGLLTPARVWDRVERAAAAGRADTIEASARWLTGTEAADALRLSDAIRNPATVLQGAAGLADTAHVREALVLALTRLARRDSAGAATAWQTLASRFAFDPDQRNRVGAALALYNAIDAGPDAIQRLASLPAAAQTLATREWRVRAAVAAGDWQAAATAIDALPATALEHDEWRYWQARVNQHLGNEATALDEYSALAREATFYGFLAADQANLPYSICPATVPTRSAIDAEVTRDPGMARAFEFFALALLPEARREWNRAFAALTPAQQRQALVLANARGWYDRAVFALAKSGDLEFYALRFPLADKSRVLTAARSAGIDAAWAFAIIRAETAWQTDARSGADARGLMQLLPATAQQVARRSGLPYAGAASLYDPAINIPLGTQYLAHMADRYDDSPWLATAAYNAGPGNVTRWLARRPGLDPARFILTIPFTETRQYVTRVLAFTTLYDWRLHAAAQTVSSRLPAIGSAYDMAADPARKRVVCRAPAPPATAASVATARSVSP
ncbi:MAG TPA: transglycosylase SLT domain-containing protein [Rhodanobacteraceae bacterium]|nr:transglycosylase SLT domain-containing protein [Rhodanobacteraceae bacterium]